MIRTGAVIFDDLEQPGTGWACHAGSEPSRISGLHDLPSDTIWLVNVERDVMNEAGLTGHAFYRDTAFLRINTRALQTELGLLGHEGEPYAPDQSAKIIANIFERMATLWCAFTESDREDWKPHAYGFKNAMREVLLPYDPVLGEALLAAVKESYQDYTRCETPVVSARPALGFLVVPRVEHAFHVLSTPIPATDKPKVVTPPRGLQREALQEWVVQQPGPMLIRASIKRMDGDISGLLNYGGVSPVRIKNEGNYGYREASTRQWMTSQELMLFSRHGELVVHEALLFDRFVKMTELPMVASWFDRIEPFDHLSYSLSLFADNLWTSATANHARFTHRMVSANLIAPFLRAADRLRCLDYVFRVIEQGYDVIGYGAGRIGVKFADDHLKSGESLRVAAMAGLLPPHLMHDAPVQPAPPMIEPDETYLTVVEIIANQMRDTYLQLDAEIVNERFGQHADAA